MLTLSAADLDGLLALFLFPFFRILAWLSFDPLLGNRSSPVSVRVSLALVLTFAIAPPLAPVAKVAL